MPLPTVPGPWNFYRLGPTKEKDLFKRRRDTYDGVVVPAHIASFFSLVLGYAGLTGFCSGICYATSKKADQDIDV